MMFGSQTTASIVRPLLEEHSLELSVGIDRFTPKSKYATPDATLVAYGRGTYPLGFVIDEQGVVQQVVEGLAQLEDALKKSAESAAR